MTGVVRDESGGVLPGVTVEVRGAGGTPRSVVTDGRRARSNRERPFATATFDNVSPF
jgi:hypothetical protein